MLTTLLVTAIAVILTATYFTLSPRRRILKLGLDPKSLPRIEDALSQLAGVTGGTVHENNEAEVFQNGDLIEAMMLEIERARHSVHFETFVWTKGVLERDFVGLLCKKVQRGVKVRVVIDAVGARGADRRQLKKLRDHGVELAEYHPISLFNLRRFNNRTHRKLLIVDGEVAFTFGHGIRDRWLGHAEDRYHWRDTGVRLRGPVVCSLQSIFVQDWIEASRTVPFERGCFVKGTGCGHVSAHVVSSSSRGGHSSVALLYMLAIASARHEIIIQNPYFTPDLVVPELLCKMVEKGVAVHLMVPGKWTDSHFVRRAGQHLYRQLLAAGVRLYEFEPALLHQKIVVIDGVWSHIGTTNFDARSLALNAEIGVGLLDKNIARELKHAFEHDLKRSRELTLEDWERRPWYKHMLDWCAYQLHGQI